MSKYAIRWSQLQPQGGPEAYDWRFILAECLKLAVIAFGAWWVIWGLFPGVR